MPLDSSHQLGYIRVGDSCQLEDRECSKNLKEVGGKCQVIEVNDNPTIEAGCEDRVLGDQLYDAILGVFVRRMESRRQRHTPW